MNFSMLAFSDLFGDIENYFANFETAADSCRTIMLWLAIALVIAFIAVKVAFYFTAPKPVQGDVVADKRQKTANKVGLFAALAYVVTAIVAFSAFYFTDVNAGEDYLVPITFYPLLVFAIVAIAGGIAVAFKPVKPVKIAALSLGGAALVAAIVCLIVYYATGDAGDWNGVTLDGATDAGLYISAIALTAIIIVVSFITDKTKGFDTRAITFAAISIALSFALSYIRILHMPMGGSITFASMLPLMLYSYMFGCKKGLIAGIVYGFFTGNTRPLAFAPRTVCARLSRCVYGYGTYGLPPQRCFAQRKNAHAVHPRRDNRGRYALYLPLLLGRVRIRHVRCRLRRGIRHFGACQPLFLFVCISVDVCHSRNSNSDCSGCDTALFGKLPQAGVTLRQL